MANLRRRGSSLRPARAVAACHECEQPGGTERCGDCRKPMCRDCYEREQGECRACGADDPGFGRAA